MRVRNCLSQPESRQQQLPTRTSEQLAALARLNLVHSRPSLSLPTLSSLPGSYSRARGDDAAVTLAHTGITAGLGSLDLWKVSNGNCTAFLRDALNEWLEANGAAEVAAAAGFHFGVATDLAECEIPAGQALAFIEAESAGELVLGPGLARMEASCLGLGRDFYVVLFAAIHQWMPTYDLEDARLQVEQWKESAEEDWDQTVDASFEEYCKRANLHFPSVEADMPKFLCDIDWSAVNQSAARLDALRDSEFGDLIAAALDLRNLRRAFHDGAPSFEHTWEDGPLPAWLIHFEKHDAIEQCFDDESQTWLEYSHRPLWMNLFSPSSLTEFRSVLDDVERFLKVNVLLAQIQKRFSEMETKHASPRQRRKCA